MPIPFIIAGLAALGGAVIGGAAKAVNDDYEAELVSINNKIESLIDDTEASYNKTRSNLEFSLENLSELREVTFNNSLKRFVNSYSKIKNVQLKSETALSIDVLKDMQNFNLDFQNNSPKKLNYESYEVLSKKGAIMGALFGGTYLVTSVVKGVKLQGEIEKAKTNYSKVKAEVQAVKTVETGLKKIIKRSKELSDVIRAVDFRFNLAIEEMEKNIKAYGVDFANYKVETQKQIYVTAQLAQLQKILIKAPVITSEGELDKRCSEAISNASTILNKMAQLEEEV